MRDVEHEVVEYVSWLIYARRRELRSRWRRLSCFQQAVLVLVHLRKNETLQQVGVGFGVTTATAGRYVTEAVVLADHAPTLLDALHHHDPNEFLILDSTLIRTDRVAADEPYAARELSEELGVRVPVRFMFKFLCREGISPVWFGVHEAVVAEPLVPDPGEIAWQGWLTEAELCEVVDQWLFVPGGREALRRYLQSGSGS